MSYLGPVTNSLDGSWAEAVRAACQPVFDAAQVGFTHQDQGDSALLWEADAELFAERYPDSGIVESYGDQWPAPCIDYWIYIESEKRQVRLSIEGWGFADMNVPITGDGAVDGRAIAAKFANILKVRKRS